MGRPRFDHLCGDCGGRADSRRGVAGRSPDLCELAKGLAAAHPEWLVWGARCQRPGWAGPCAFLVRGHVEEAS